MKKQLLPKFIEIETSTYCNRDCDWCPNNLFDRSKKQRLIDETLFDKIIQDLRSENFSGDIALHNYNEPLLDPYLYKHISKLNQQLKRAKIKILTNGDYLTLDEITKLEKNNVALLRITNYDEGDCSEKLKLFEDISTSKYEKDEYGEKYSYVFKSMPIEFWNPNFDHFTNRGGILSGETGNNICYLPLLSSAIDVDGNMKICCEVYSGSPFHLDNGVIGNLKHSSFSELWFSKQYNDLRNGLLDNQKNNPICQSCQNIPKSTNKVDEKLISTWRTFLKNGNLYD